MQAGWTRNALYELDSVLTLAGSGRLAELEAAVATAGVRPGSPGRSRPAKGAAARREAVSQ